MPAWPDDYVESVLEDVKKYDGIRKIVRAGLIERCSVKFCPPEKLHPNPSDEFSQSEIGPNMGIVGQYVEQIKVDEALHYPIFADPMIVQKMEPDGYMLVNGHHRWFAAVRMGIKKVHIRIVNLIGEEDLKRMIRKTANSKLAVFDLDEVLLAADVENQAPIRDQLFSRMIKERLRTGAPEIIKQLKEKGYDICIYSAGYLSEEYIQDFFSMYDISVDVIINGFNEKRKNSTTNEGRIRELMREKYKESVHVDNESVLQTNHETKEYEHFENDDPEKSWQESITEIINRI